MVVGGVCGGGGKGEKKEGGYNFCGVILITARGF